MAIFYLELLIRITIHNKDRVLDIWPSVSDHMSKLTLVASEAVSKRPFLLERTVNGLLRLSVRLARKEDLASLGTYVISLAQSIVDQCRVFLCDSLFKIGSTITFPVWGLIIAEI
jgi:hypothetical protein